MALTTIQHIVHPEIASYGDSTFKAISLGGDMGRKVCQLRYVGDFSHQHRQTTKEIYDTTTSFQSRDVMTHLEPTALHMGDVVLAECWFVCKELLGTWQTTFHLMSI